LYANEKKYYGPSCPTIVCSSQERGSGYRWVLPGAIKFSLLDFRQGIHPILTIEDYTGSSSRHTRPRIPSSAHLIFFLSLFGIVYPKFLIKHIRTPSSIFLIAAIICPTPTRSHVPLRHTHAGSLL